MTEALAIVGAALDEEVEPDVLAARLGLERGVTGFVVHTVAVALYCRLRFADFRAAVTAAVRLGGDTDSVAAVVGGLVGAAVGADGLPREWVDGLVEWPRDVAWMRALARRLAEGGAPVAVRWWAVPARNLVFVGLAVTHVGRKWAMAVRR